MELWLPLINHAGTASAVREVTPLWPLAPGLQAADSHGFAELAAAVIGPVLR